MSESLDWPCIALLCAAAVAMVFHYWPWMIV